MRSVLDCAKMFRELLLLKAQGNPRKLASYFESNRPAALRFGAESAVLNLWAIPRRDFGSRCVRPTFSARCGVNSD